MPPRNAEVGVRASELLPGVPSAERVNGKAKKKKNFDKSIKKKKLVIMYIISSGVSKTGFVEIVR